MRGHLYVTLQQCFVIAGLSTDLLVLGSKKAQHPHKKAILTYIIHWVYFDPGIFVANVNQIKSTINEQKLLNLIDFDRSQT